ncbi:hydrolase [Clostridia bacterium]|nr:hydrolase [Clostridia bacterium]
MRIAKNIEMLEIKANNGVIYPILAWDEHNLVLIDAGFPGQIDLITAGITKAGRPAKDITAIILTHQDIDHIGCVRELLELAPNAQVMAHIDEAPYINGEKTPIKLAALSARYDDLPDDMKIMHDKLKAGFANRRIKIDKFLQDGEILPICDGIEIIHTPGHTHGHICLLFRESGVLVGGDAVNIQEGKLIGANPNHTADLKSAEESFAKIRDSGASFVVAYHGGCYTENTTS